MKSRPVPAHVKSSAIFGGKDNEYRYVLKRVWDESLPSICFIMLNPSTADETHDDPTVAKCRRLAEKWGYGTLYVLNLFALRSTDPKALRKHIDPVGFCNDDHLYGIFWRADIVVTAWGNHGSYMGRSRDVMRLINRFGRNRTYHLTLTKSGEPGHPLYVREDTELKENR